MVYFNDLKETNFYNIFCSNWINLPDKVFVNDNWDVKFFLHNSHLFNEENQQFMNNFQDFFKKMGNELYLASGKYHVLDDTYKAMYAPMLFESTMNITEISDQVSYEIGDRINLNMCDDFIWNPNGKWGIYNFSHYYLFFLGYDPIMQEEIDYFFQKQEGIRKNEDFLAMLRHEFRFRKISDEDQIKILHEMGKNNKWFSIPPVR